MEKLILFHGSDKIIEKPQFMMGRRNNDFGLGFYCTQDIELAKEWACASDHGGYANKYTIDISDLKILRLTDLEYSILNWISVLVKNRAFRIRNQIAGRALKYLNDNFSVNVSAYDAVIGYRADDSYFDFADSFLNNSITVEQLAAAMRLGKPGEQFVIKSEYAFSKLKFEEAVTANREVYYPRRNERNITAQQAYKNIVSEESDGLYMIDIIRQQVKNNDKRIPGNIP